MMREVKTIRWRRWAWAGISVALLSGCASDKQSKAPKEDPLLGSAGGSGPISATPIANLPPPPSTQAPAGPLSPASPTSQAALAGGAFQPLTGGSNLRIGPANEVNLQTPTFAPVQQPPPQSRNEPKPPPGVLAVVTADNSNNSRPTEPNWGRAQGASPQVAINSLEEGYNLLSRYRVKWQKMDQANGEWRFSCSLPDKADPTKSRVFTADAPTQIEALRLALEQIAKEQ